MQSSSESSDDTEEVLSDISLLDDYLEGVFTHMQKKDDPQEDDLIKTAIYGTADGVQKVIDSGVNINSTNDEGKTALMYAVKNGKEDIVKLLIKCGADIDIFDNYRRTALVYSIFHIRKSIMMLLIEYEAEVNIVDHEGKTALMFASMSGLEQAILSLINAGAEVNMVDHEGKTALMFASKFGQEQAILSLINAGADVNMVDHEGKTALMFASKFGQEQATLSLINASAEVNMVDHKGKTALMFASKSGKEQATLSLINAGADVNMVNHKGKTALMFASISGQEQATLSLINAGAEVNMVDHEGKTALNYALISSEELTVLLIKRENTLLNIRDIYGRTPLFYAILHKTSTSSYLAEQGGDLHVRDNHNVTPLSFFICHCLACTFEDEDEDEDEHINQILALFKEKGVTKEEFVQTLINVLFCKLLSFGLVKREEFLLDSIDHLLEKTVQIYGEFTEAKWKNAFEYIISMISRDKYTFPALKEAMSILIDLGADPDTADEVGNTAIHYAAQQILFGQSAEIVLNIFNELQALGSSLVRKNCRGETPLLFLLSELGNYPYKYRRDSTSPSISTTITGVTKICKCIRAVSPMSTFTTANGESVFHLVLKAWKAWRLKEYWKHDDLMLHLLELYAPPIVKYGVTVNKVDDDMSSPVHLWASLVFTRGDRSESVTTEDLNFEQLLEAILNHLKKCGAVLNVPNAVGQTPLHICETWNAVKLLVKSGANPGVLDSEQRSPFLIAAQRYFGMEAGCFYPDVTEDVVTFWKTAADMKLDLWAYDVNGNSVFSILIESEQFLLAKSLLEITCGDGYIKSDETLVALLSDICKDESTKTTWKELLVKEILKTISRPMDMKMPLQHCCRNIKNSYKEHSFDSVHWQIAKKLLSFGAEGSCCLDIAEGYPELHALLTQPLDMDEVPLAIPWTSHSHKYARKLAQVARRQQCQIVEVYWYHTEPIGKGVFGHVFAGINSKDGMEVAVKRIENLRLERRQDEREAYTFASLTGCRNVVHYLAFCTDVHFSFIILELMEGNLNEYFESPHFNSSNNTTLCRDVFCGINYLHGENIVHRDIKPTNILYKTHPELCVKIADFDLSRRLDIDSSFTVMAPGVGSRGWIAPEVVKSTPYKHTMESDIFSCGLITHYIFSPQKHPFYPTVCTGKSDLQIIQETEKNISDGEMESFEGSIVPEASDCIKKMLDINEKERPTAEAVLKHPMFWSNKKKMNLLTAVGNQPEFEIPRCKVTFPSFVESDLESNVATIVKYGKWDDPRYTHMPGIYSEMTKPIVKPAKKGKYHTIKPRNYDVTSAVDLVRFIRNSIAHVSDVSRPSPIRIEILDNAVFLEYFPNITMEVYNAVTKHGWSLLREEIQHAIEDN